ncbi:MAG: hypothetical protein ACE5FC_03405 [Myxococcota bacterium]
MPPVPHIAFVQGAGGLSQRIFSGRATLSGLGRDLRLVVDGRALHLAYKDVHPGEDGLCEAMAENEDVHIETRLVPGPGYVEVVSQLTALRPLTLSSFEHAYTAHDLSRWGRLDHLWLPVVKSEIRRAVGKPALRTPCIVAQEKDRSAALVADVDAFERAQRLPPVLDFERPATLKVGLAAGHPAGEGLLRRNRSEGALLPDHDVMTLSFVIVLADGVQPQGGLGSALRFAWARFGEPRLDDLAPQTLPFDDYARYAYDAAFDRFDLWRDVFLEAGPAGGIACRIKRPPAQPDALPARKRFERSVRVRAGLGGALPWRRRRKILRRGADFANDHLHFTTRANQLRSAYGMAHYARRWKDPKLQSSAREIIRLALAAPVEKGLFPSVYVGTPDRPAWVRGTKGAFFDDRYSVPDLCESALWMVRLATDLGIDAGLIDRARALGETLQRLQVEGGALPARVSVNPLGGVHGSGRVRPRGPTAIAGALFARLGKILKDDRFMEAAREAGRCVINDLAPAHRWQDLETFFSWGSRPARWRDRQTGIRPQSILPMAWAADLLLLLHAKDKEGWLAPALAVLDELLFHQQIWNADFLDFDTRGGFGATNIDARWSDPRQALFAPLLLRAHEATGAREYGLRAAAALRAGFTLMRIPENEKLAPAVMAGLTEGEYGMTVAGYEWRDGEARPDPDLSFDWGSGSACAAAAWVQEHYGDLFVNLSGRTAVGLNGCRVRKARITKTGIDLRIERLGDAEPRHRNPLARDKARTLVLRARGPSEGKLRVRIDGADLGAIDRRRLLRGFPLPQS